MKTTRPFLPQESNALRIAGVSSEPSRLGLMVQVFLSLTPGLGPCGFESLQVTDETLRANRTEVKKRMLKQTGCSNKTSYSQFL